MIDSILHDFIDERIAEIKSDPSILNWVFENETVERLEQIKEWVNTAKIRTVYHHPRDEADLPCYAIVLESSNESDQIIGMTGDLKSEILISTMDDGWIGSDSDIMRTNTFLPTDVSQYYSSVYSLDGRRCCRMYGKQDVSQDKGIWIDFENSVLEGGYVSLTGMANVTFLIKSSRSGTFLQFGFGEDAHEEQTFPITITNKGVWERVVLDIRKVADRNKDQIRYMSFKITDDSSITDIYIDSLKGEKSAGELWDEAYFDHIYRIESWANNADLSLIMYEILKWNLMRYRTYLETSWGFMAQRVLGSDLMPQPEWYPEFAYIRALSYNLKTIEAIPRETDLSTLQIRVGNIDWGA